MIRLRPIESRDIDSVLRFSQVPGMFNLAPDRDLLAERVEKSTRSFEGKIPEIENTKYVFVAENMATGEILGTSMIAGQHGTNESPHFYFEVGKEERFSKTIGTGFIHGTLTLGYSIDGPSEVGALVVDAAARHLPVKVGRQLSFVRFLYLARHRTRFRDHVIAELLPPLNRRGLSPLWEAVGRRFTNMDYWEADQLCAKNKDFIFDLFPTGKIYTTFLTAEARNSIGKVGKDTEPVFHLLKRIGFRYVDQIDPFDGGPHLWANTDEIAPVKATKSFFYAPPGGGTSSMPGLIHKEEPGAPFRAYSIEARFNEDGKLAIDDEQTRRTIERELALKAGDAVFFVPYY